VAAYLTQTQKLVRGIPWVAGETFFNVLCGVLTVVLIGRFISPAELGVASTATATVLLVELVSKAGIPEAVIRSKSGDTIVTDTAFVVAMACAFLGMGICALAAYPLASMYGDNRLIALIPAASLVLPLNAFAAVPSAIMIRKMRAPKLTRRLIGGRSFGLFSLCILGAIGWSAWTVVLSDVATSCGSLVMILTAAKRWPHIRLSRKEVPRLLRFGLMISVESMLYSLTFRAFSLLFGYFHGLSALGNFQFALRIADQGANLVNYSVNRFGLSFFAGKERTAADITSSFLTGSQLIAAITTPILAGVALVARDLVPVVFGSKWDLAIPFLQIIAISLLVTFQRILTGSALRARGHQSVMVGFAAFGAAFAVITCVATAKLPPIYGVIGFAARLVFVAPFVVLAIDRLLRISFTAHLSALIGPTAAAVIMAVAVISFQLALIGAAPVTRLAGSILLGVAAYLIALCFFCPAVFTNAKSLLPRRTIRG
jgi:teichuronic acid exporter